MNDYITLITSKNPSNKIYNVVDGTLVKTPPIYEGVRHAKTIKIEGLAHLKIILEWLGGLENSILVLGYIEGSTEYNLISESKLKELTGLETVTGLHHAGGITYAARLKKSFTQSSFFIFDRDEVEGMPVELVYENHDTWWSKMCEAYPMLEGCGYLLNRSNSGRVLHKGLQTAKDNFHVYVQAKDAGDIERFGKSALIHSFTRGVGFMKENKNGGFRPWSIFDPTTFSREREVFDGSPTILNNELSILKSEVYHSPGPVVDTSKLTTPNIEQQESIGMTLDVNKDGGIHLSNNVSLTLDEIIEFKDFGRITLREFIEKADGIRARCQSPFRQDSKSMAAYINFTKSGDPFLHDVGTATNYYLRHLNSDVFSNLKSRVTGPGEVVKTPGVVIPKFSDRLNELDRAATDKNNQLELAKSLVLEVDRIKREDLKIDRFGEICSIMGWTKANFSKILKNYRGINTDAKGRDWLLKNVVLLNEGAGGYYNLDVKIFQLKTTLNDNYADLELGDETPASVINSSADKLIAQGLGWQPNDSDFFSFSGKKYVNTYTPSSITPIQGDVSQWLILMHYIYGCHTNLVLQHMAFTLQQPLKKIRWQILTWGEPRTGKSFTLIPLIKILGNAASDISNEMLEAGWDDIWAKKKVTVFNEVMQESKKVFNHLKSKFSDSSVEALNLKGGSIMLQQNYYSIYMFSNFDNALRFDVAQQKLLVIKAPDEKMNQDFYDILDKLCNTEAFISACYYYLLNLDVSDFSFNKLPITSQAASDMAAKSVPDYELYIVEMIEHKQDVFKTGTFKFKTLRQCLVDDHIRCSDKNISRILIDKGFKKVVWNKNGRGVYWTNNPELILNPNLIIDEPLDIKLPIIT